MILSQILRGLADVTAEAAAERGGELADIDGAVLAAALRHAVGLVVASMGESVPGTIVSVLQAAAGAAEDAAADGADLAGVVTAAADAAVVALDKTTEQLDVLADAGVVDAGGRGLLVLLDALSEDRVRPRARRGRSMCRPPPGRRGRRRGAAPRPRFEVMYLLSGCEPDGVEQLRQRLDELGDSVAIAASASDGGPLLGARALRRRRRRHRGGAAVRHAEPDPDHRAHRGRGPHAPGGWTRERAVLAVVDGDGAAELFAGEGAHVLRPDPMRRTRRPR